MLVARQKPHKETSQMKITFLAGTALTVPAFASAQSAVSDTETHTLLSQSMSVQQQILSYEQQILTELKVIAAENMVSPAQRAFLAEKVRQLAAISAQAGTGTASPPCRPRASHRDPAVRRCSIARHLRLWT